MIIGIDLCSLPYGTGVSNYTLNLVKNLVKIDRSNQYKLFFSSLRQPLSPEVLKLAVLPHVKIYHYYFPPTLLEFIWNRLHLFPIELFIGKCDVFHTWDWTQPPSLWAKTITTIHDFVPFLFPEKQHQKTISTFKQKLYWASRECRHFICVSKNSQSDLLRLFPQIESKKTSVVHEAPEDRYLHFAKLDEADRQTKISSIHHQYGLSKYILAVGTREPRKNLDRLINAFLSYKHTHPQSPIELAISGKYGWGQDITSPDPSIKILGYVPDKDITALYAGAICLVYPSLYEGFGLPIINAMTVGVPVITSNISSLPEVGGSAALYVDPLNTEEMAQSISQINHDSTLRRRLINKGFTQAHKFSWTKTARQTLEIYQNL